MQFLEISWDFGILGFSKILGFFQRFFGIFDEVYEDFQSNLPLGEKFRFVSTFLLAVYHNLLSCRAYTAIEACVTLNESGLVVLSM